MDELVEAMEKWLKNHPNPGAKILIVGSRTFSAAEALDEIKADTSMGKTFRQNIMQVATELFLKRNKVEGEK